MLNVPTSTWEMTHCAITSMISPSSYFAADRVHLEAIFLGYSRKMYSLEYLEICTPDHSVLPTTVASQ